MPLPLPHSIGVRHFIPGEEDAHGNPVDFWSPPVERAVHGLAPGVQDVPSNPNRDLSIIEWTVYAPAGFQIDDRDIVVIGGKEFTVEGHVKDYTLGPWDNPVAGVTFELRRAEG